MGSPTQRGVARTLFGRSGGSLPPDAHRHPAVAVTALGLGQRRGGGSGITGAESPARRRAGSGPRGIPSGREIGPLGTASRAIGGLLVVGLAVGVAGVTWWDVAAAAVALPVTATAAASLVIAGYQRFAPGSLARAPQQLCSSPSCAVTLIVVGTAAALSALTPGSMVAFWLWIGASLLLAAVRGYGGCEVLAFPNALMGRRDQIGCILYTPIDRAEASRRRRRKRPFASRSPLH